MLTSTAAAAAVQVGMTLSLVYLVMVHPQRTTPVI
jgi:hypothetical protein